MAIECLKLGEEGGAKNIAAILSHVTAPRTNVMLPRLSVQQLLEVWLVCNQWYLNMKEELKLPVMLKLQRYASSSPWSLCDSVMEHT